MNKTELVAAMAEQTNLSKKDAEAALKAFVDVVSEELKKGEKVQLVGFGTLKYPKEQQEKEEIRRLARPWKSKLPKLRNSKQEKL